MAPLRPEKIFQIPRSDAKGQCIIVHVTPSAATIELNAKIVVTDGECHYSFDLKENKVKRLQDDGAHQSEDDWKSALRACFLADSRPEDNEWKTKTEMTCTVKEDLVVIEVRQDINGIKQKLGHIDIPANEGEINLWGWLVEVCKEKDDVQRQALLATQQTKKEETTIAELTKQLEDLIKAKKEHEEALILRFQKLLNEKKRYYRQQNSMGRKNNAAQDEISNNGKRKAKAAEISSEDELDMDEAPEATNGQDDQGSDRATTPEESTDDEDADSYVVLKKKTKDEEEDVEKSKAKKPINRTIIGKQTNQSKNPAPKDDVTMNDSDTDSEDEL